MYTSLVAEVRIERVRVEYMKDLYIRPWLLRKIRLEGKGFKKVSKFSWIIFKKNLAMIDTFENFMSLNSRPVMKFPVAMLQTRQFMQ